MGINVNIVAVLLCGVASMVWGFLWYGPLFGKQWSKLMGMTSEKSIKEAKQKAPKLYGGSFILSLIMAYVLAHFISFVGAYSALEGLQTGVWVWVGFILPPAVINWMWSDKPKDLLTIDVTYHLAVLMTMGAILALLK